MQKANELKELYKDFKAANTSGKVQLILYIIGWTIVCFGLPISYLIATAIGYVGIPPLSIPVIATGCLVIFIASAIVTTGE